MVVLHSDAFVSTPFSAAFRRVPEDMRGGRGHPDERDLAGGHRGGAEGDGQLPAPGPLPLHQGQEDTQYNDKGASCEKGVHKNVLVKNMGNILVFILEQNFYLV